MSRPLAFVVLASLMAALIGIAGLIRDDDDFAAPDQPASVPSDKPARGPSDESAGGLTDEPTTSPLDYDIVTIGGRHSRRIEERAGNGLALWPLNATVFTTSEAAVDDYVEKVINIAGFRPELRRGARPTEFHHNYQSAETTIIAATPDSGNTWLVVDVNSPALSIDLVERNGHGNSSQTSLRVSGSGSAVGGSGQLFVDEAKPVAVALGRDEREDFSIIVPWDGDGPVRVRLAATALDSGSPSIVAFSVSPQPPTTDIGVTGIADGEVLDVRSAPGPAGQTVTTLRPTARVIAHTGETKIVDGQEWWRIETGDLIFGWVNRDFLRMQSRFDHAPAVRAEMTAMAEQALALFGGSAERFAFDPSEYADRLVVGGLASAAGSWTGPMLVDRFSLDSTIYDWTPTGTITRCENCQITVVDFLDVRRDDSENALYSLANSSQIESSRDLDADDMVFVPVDRFASVVAFIGPTDGNVSGWRTYTFTFDFTNDGPQIRAVWRWGEMP